MTTWKIEVDWYRNGFGDAEDDISAYVKEASWNLGLADEYEMVAGESRLELTLNNVDQRFSPEGTAGPYYGSVVPKRMVRVQSISSLGTITHWTGWLERISPQPGSLRERTARLTATGPKKYLEEQSVYAPLLTNITADVVIGTVIKQVREWFPGMPHTFILDHPTMSILGTSILCVPDQGMNLGVGNTIFPYVGDGWDDGIPAMKAIADVVRGERGRFFMDRGGTAVFWDRKYIPDNIQSNSGTVNDGQWTSLNYDYGDNIINRAIVTVYPRTIGTVPTNVLWTLEKPFELRHQQEKTIRAQFTDTNSDIRVSTDPDSCALNVSWTPPSRLIDVSAEYTTRGAKVTFFNNAFFEHVDVDNLVITGIKITHQQQLDIIEEDTDSIAQYGARELRIDTSTMDDENTARGIAQRESTRRAQPTGLIDSFLLREKDDASNLAQCLQWTMGTRIRIIDNQVLHDENYIILGEDHTLSNGLKTHDVSYIVMEAGRENWFILGSSLLDGDDILFV